MNNDDRIDDIDMSFEKDLDDIIGDDKSEFDDDITDYEKKLEKAMELDSVIDRDFEIEEALDFDIKKLDSETDDEVTDLRIDVSDEDFDLNDEENAMVPYEENENEADGDMNKEKKPKKKKGLKIFLIVLAVLALLVGFFIGTPVGRKALYSLAGKFLQGNMDYLEGKSEDVTAFYVTIPTPTPTPLPDSEITPTPELAEDPEPVKEEEIYAKNYLLFGIEELNGGMNTDTIMLLTINTRDKTLKFTSILRDTYVDIPGTNPNKINAAYAFGTKQGENTSDKMYYGGMKLIEAIEKQFEIPIEGFACVRFSDFEHIVDRLGGVDIELGSKEASYLRTTNYISNPAYRTVQQGWNHMNGNQALGYCRVRKVVTLGGANNDYGRTVRQRRVINALIAQYKSKSITELLPIMTDCLAYIHTNMTAEQITDIFTNVVENNITNFEENRIPFDGMFSDSSKEGIFNGSYNVTYALVIGKYRDQVNQKLHDILYNDPTAVNEEASGDADAMASPVPAAATP